MNRITNRIVSFMLAITMITLTASTAKAQTTVITPSNAAGNGVVISDFGNNTSPATISGTNPYDGNGSLQMTITGPGQQPGAFFAFATPQTLGSFSSVGMSYFAALGSTGAPTLRLYLTGLSNSNQSNRSDGYLGFIGTQQNVWTTNSLNSALGNFFFRAGGKGQTDLGCSNTGYTGSFDDRMQTIGQWISTCDGVGDNINLTTAMIVGFGVDYGTFPSFSGSTTVYADRINASFTGGPSVDFNFELRETPTDTVPEPATMTMLATGLVGIASASAKRRKNKKPRMSAAPLA